MKRNLGTRQWVPALWVSPDTGIAVGIYAPVAEAKKAPSILLDAKDLSELRREAAYGKTGGMAVFFSQVAHFYHIDFGHRTFSNWAPLAKCCCESRGNLQKAAPPTVRVQRHGRGGVQVEHIRLNTSG